MKINHLMRTLLIAGAGLGMMGAAQAQNLLQNGGFEAPEVTGSCCTTTPTAPLPGWVVQNGDVNVVAGTFGSSAGNLAYEANQYLDLIGEQNAPTTLFQDFTTVAGHSYELSFAYSNNPFAGANSRSADYAVLGGGLAGTVTHSSATNSDLDWTVFTQRFVATGTTSRLSFSENVSGANAGLLLDAVSVSAVPEPATWAMMIAGFGMVGGTMRRRKAAARIAFA